MNQNAPRVSIGMPVYNGERFVAQAVQSILSQTFRDFELIISDNASTDATERICREYAERDGRIRYYRSEQNRGAAWNNNRVVELARGEYFKWQSHDDYCDPTFIEKCLAGIRSNPSVVLCYPQFVRVDEQGRRLGSSVKSSRVIGDGEPHRRHRSLIYRRDSCEEIFGIARTAVVRKTSLIGPYSNSDDTFLAELILHGCFREVPEPLFFYRIHPTQSTRAYPSRLDRMAWFKPSAGAGFSLPFLRLFAGHMSAVRRSPLVWREKVRCYRSLVGWFWYFRDWLAEDFRALLHRYVAPWLKRHAPWTRPLWHAIKSRWHAIKSRLRRLESATARARRARRAQLESWELEAEE
jgi:glycosyltransferase involved in cell wall biosynthesis